MSTDNNERLSSGSLLAQNAVWNLLGASAPMLVALFATPLIIRWLGTERFGVLTLAWMVIGYFSLFDFGLSRALTQGVAEKLGARQDEKIPALVWNSLLVMLFFGLVGMLILGLLSPWLVHHVLKIPEALQPETLWTFFLLTLSVPLVISTAGLQGILEAHQRFGLTNAVRASMGVLTIVGPLLVIRFSRSLFAVVAVLLGIRLLAWWANLLLCLHVTPALRHPMALQWSALEGLIRFGSWMTVTNVVGPLMTYLDRFFIGAMISVAAVAYYATAYEVVSNLAVIPYSIVAVLFPAFAAHFGPNRSRVRLLFSRAVKYTFLVLFPATFLIVALAGEGLQLWLGPEFAKNSLRALQWLAFGRFLNGLAQIPFALVQGAGHPDFTGKLHLIELPFYLTAVWWLTATLGIEGAAIAWVGRVVVDMMVLFGMAQRLLRYSTRVIWHMTFVMGLTILGLVLAAFPMGTPEKVLFIFVTLFTFGAFGWPWIRDEANTQMILSIFDRSATTVEQGR